MIVKNKLIWCVNLEKDKNVLKNQMSKKSGLRSFSKALFEYMRNAIEFAHLKSHLHKKFFSSRTNIASLECLTE